MFRFGWLILFIFWGADASFGQVKLYAPGLRADDTLTSFVGMINPLQSNLEVRLKGYAVDGVLIGDKVITLAKFARIETPVTELFEDGTPAWIEVDAAVTVAGYVRYEHADGKRFSLVSMNRIAGDMAYVAQLTGFDENEPSEIFLVNTGDTESGAQVQPIVLKKHADNVSLAETAVPIPAFGAPHQQTSFRYDAVYTKSDEEVIWDAIRGESGAKLAGIQHFGDLSPEGKHLATLALPRTSHRAMYVSALHPNVEAFTTRFLLVNTYAKARLPVIITAYYENDVTRSFRVDLDPYEKREFLFNNPVQPELPANARWYQIMPYEGGLAGFQMVASKDGESFTALEALDLPGSTVDLPCTQNSDRYRTTITIINPTEGHICSNVVGFDDSGKIAGFAANVIVKPLQKNEYQLEDLFGQKAAQVTWTRIYTNIGTVMAYALVRDTEGPGLAALQGTPTVALGGDTFSADFEFWQLDVLGEQEWKIQDFGREYPFFHTTKAAPSQQVQSNQYYWSYNYPVPGEFFMESVFAAKTGVLYLGYRSHYDGLIPPFLSDGLPDQVAFMSPYFETPNYGQFYLSYWARFVNPEFATKESQYGMVVHEEGSDQWWWFGVEGILLQERPRTVGEPWRPVYYVNENVMLTGWMPFERAIPAELMGKRIQVGLFYKHIPGEAFPNGPMMFIDRIRVSAEQLEYTNFNSVYGGGTFTYEQAP